MNMLGRYILMASDLSVSPLTPPPPPTQMGSQLARKAGANAKLRRKAASGELARLVRAGAGRRRRNGRPNS